MKAKKKTQRKIIIYLSVVLIAVLTLFAIYTVQKIENGISYNLTAEEAQKIIKDTFNDIPNNVSTGANYIANSLNIKVNSVTLVENRKTVAECEYETLAIGDLVVPNVEKYVTDAYGVYEKRDMEGLKTNATKIKLELAELIKKDLEDATSLTGTVQIEIYEVSKNVFEVYLPDELVNTLMGGILDVQSSIKAVKKIEYNGETINIARHNTVRTGIIDCFNLDSYSKRVPDTNPPLEKVWNNFKYDFYRNFIKDNNWHYLTNGLGNTLAITFFAVLLGILIGFITAVIRCLNQKTGRAEFFSDICKVYVSVMRGMPVMVQLIIMYFVILLPMGVDKFIAAIICFGLNSGAYVSEIIRGGIMSIDEGQTEAGRSLGFNYVQTMVFIILPQAFKAVLPALANEFIALLKESSIAFYIGVADLTLGGIKIRSITYSNFMPLLTVGIIYLVVVLGLSKLVSILERRLSKGDKR